MGTANAEPSPDKVKDKVEKFEKEYSKLAEDYNDAKEDYDAGKKKLSDVKSDQKDAKDNLDGLKGKVSELANVAYSGVDYNSPSYLMSSEKAPDKALQQAADLGYLSESQEATLDKYTEEKDKLDDLKSEANKTKKKSAERLKDAKSAKKKAKKKLDKQQDILDKVSDDSGSSGGGSYTGSATGDAKKALDFAYAQIGDSYSMGANGPDTWDCSSLTQHAWKAGGVSLPRNSKAQAGAGKEVSWDSKKPGDLIFFYSPISHVGIYAGGNKMVHASNPSKPVAEVSLSGYYEQNQVKVVRP